MSRQPRPTLADYLVIAVTPAMVMAMIGSFVYFLLAIFYSGDFSGRLHYVMALFVFAAVLIARIAIELGKEHAMKYGLALAAATMLALGRFVDSSALLNVALIAVIWWSAHKLTVDCTLIDESQDSSGEGLLRAAGLEGGGHKAPTTVASSVELDQAAAAATPRGWRNLLRSERPKRPHTPGSWIVYVALATLPIFGFGYRFVPPQDRSYVFKLFFVYAAAGLGLLLATSFLGLRRYLRQRRLEMPGTMAASWMTLGVLLAGGVLIFTALLPRPGGEFVAGGSPIRFVSPSQEASRSGFGPEGAQKNPNDAPAASDDPNRDVPDEDRAKTGNADGGEKQAGDGGEESSQGGKDSGGDKGGQGKGDGKGAKGKSGQGKGPEGKGGQGKGGQGKGAQGKGSQGKSGLGKSSQGQGSQGQSASKSDASDKSKQGESKQGDDSQDDAAKDGQKPDESKSSDGQPRDPDVRKTESDKQEESRRASSPGSTSGSPPRTSWSPPRVAFDFGLGAMARLLQWLLWLALAVAVIVGVWRNRRAVADALRQMLAGWRDFWARLFGGKPKTAEVSAGPAAEAPTPAVAPRRFGDFVNPFEAGTLGQFTPEALVRYTFEALEAYGRDVGRPRKTDETAHEFARAVAEHAAGAQREIRVVAELYSRMAYAPATLTPSSVEPLADFWRTIPPPRRQEAATPVG